LDATPPFKSSSGHAASSSGASGASRSAEEAAELSARFARPPRKLLPGRLLDTYLFGHVAEATLRGLGMFVMLLMFFAVISATRKLLDASLSWGGALELIVYQLPRIFLFTLPMSLLYGTLHAFAEMSGRGEVIGMWGGGMSFKRMLVPPLLWASLLAASAFWVQEAIVPGAESAKDKVLANQIQNSTLVQRDVKLPSTLKDGSTVLIEGEEFNVGTKTLLRPLVTQRNAQGDLDLGVRADSARWDAQKKKWILENPHFRRWNETESSSSDANTIQSNAGVFELEAGDPSTLGKQARTRKENLLEYNYEFVSSADLQAWRASRSKKRRSPA
jgi:lipopolysaccharide export LptBFGC system permease protein LptF